jgi:hypothetical protein
MCITLGIGQDIHTEGSAVIWRKNNDPVVVGFQAFKISIKLISPCDLMPLDDIEPRVAKIMDKQCGKTYRNLFLNKLEEI